MDRFTVVLAPSKVGLWPKRASIELTCTSMGSSSKVRPTVALGVMSAMFSLMSLTLVTLVTPSLLTTVKSQRVLIR